MLVRTHGVDIKAGLLGQGLSCAVGVVLGAGFVKKDDARIYALSGDRESMTTALCKTIDVLARAHRSTVSGLSGKA
jgi:transketolase N-terminal domain/subunit